MSPAPTNRSPDLQRLRDEGYDLSVVSGTLIVRDIPYVDQARAIQRGIIAVPLCMSGDRTSAPRSHAAYWSGELPCDHHGVPLPHIGTHPVEGVALAGVPINFGLCLMPVGREYHDYHELITTYVGLLSSYVRRLDLSVTARGKRSLVPVEDEDSPFRYMDTASARAGIGALNARFSKSVAIVGLGGTGSYVLDLVAKTPVRTIHLFDDDVFLQHNAFRAPGAASLEDLDVRRMKVDHFAAIYARMHTGIVPHAAKLGPANLHLLDKVDFVFLCIDDGPAKRPIIDRLESKGKSFIDTGLGLEMGTDGLFGTARVTTSTPAMRSHVRDNNRIPLSADQASDLYATNIQVADLNALNAALAVLRWKRLIGFYADGVGEHHTTFDVDGNHMNNVDRSHRPPS